MHNRAAAYLGKNRVDGAAAVSRIGAASGVSPSATFASARMSNLLNAAIAARGDAKGATLLSGNPRHRGGSTY